MNQRWQVTCQTQSLSATKKQTKHQTMQEQYGIEDLSGDSNEKNDMFKLVEALTDTKVKSRAKRRTDNVIFRGSQMRVLLVVKSKKLQGKWK